MEAASRNISEQQSSETVASPASSTTITTTSSSNTTETNVQIIFREIHKNAWLRRLPTGDRKTGGGAYSKRGENVWVVFCVHDDRDPYLEVYVDQKVAAAHRPEWCAPLSSCLHVTPTICATQDDHHEFVVTLRTGIVKLAAPTWDVMMEWVGTLRSKLVEMKILTPPENVYSQMPQLPRGPLLPTRDPNSPLPPTPAGPLSLVPGTEMTSETPDPVSSSESSENSPLQTQTMSLQTPISNSQPPLSLPTVTLPHVSLSTIQPTSLQQSSSTPSVSVTRENVRLAATSTTSLYITQSEPPVYSRSPAVLNRASSEPGQNVTVIEVDGQIDSSNVFDFNFMGSSLEEPTSHYEHLYLGESSNQIPPMEPISPIHIESNNTTIIDTSSTTITETIPINNTPTSSISTQTYTNNILPLSPRSHDDRVRIEPPIRRRGPRMVVPIPREDQRRPLAQVPHPFRPPLPPPQAVLTLREQQVLQMSREMRHPGGVRLQLRRRDCSGSIALVDAFGAVWVAGWKQREHPTLYNALHIGDRLLSVAGVPVPSAAEAHRLIRAANCLYVEFVVRRVPFGRVLAIRRELEGQDLGLDLEGGSAEIRAVRPLSPAARAGLPPKAPSCDGLSLTNWVLTEVNSRPLNLFFKDGEVKDRLNAVGMDISILVQPFDLVKQLKKQLKSLRGYKDYLVQ